MAEKDQKTRLNRIEDDMIAKIIKQKVQEGEKMDEHKKQQLRDMLKKNQNRLRDQMTENKEKDRYGILMSEFERQMNDNDIEAYQNYENQIYAKLPGFGGSHDRQKQT